MCNNAHHFQDEVEVKLTRSTDSEIDRKSNLPNGKAYNLRTPSV